MSSRRQPAQPPALPGYTYDKLLGSGGFADVYLYTQHLPQRQVAIKVLTQDAAEGQSREHFAAEANVMAQLSTHSSIVTIYHAATAADGRPYFVMQYCPLPNLAERVRARPLGVPEVLGIGVRLAGAVETAHRAGIVHRDIKPANILTTEYGRPALSDFGIAGLVNAGPDEAGGVSIPWAPPEAVEGHPAGVGGDVYSLAATLYTLLAGRSPFAMPGSPNSRLDYTMRIKRDPVPPIGRSDVPASLEQLLGRAMAKSPAARPSTALAFARALQVVEQELRLAMTDIEVPDASWLGGAVPAEDPTAGEGRTVVRAVTEVDPTGARPADRQPVSDDGRTVLRPVTEVATGSPAPGAGSPARAAEQGWDEDDTVLGGVSRPDGEPPRRRTRTLIASVAGVVVLAAGIVVAGMLRGEIEEDPGPDPTIGTVVIPDAVPPPTGLTGERTADGAVEFTWTVPEDEDVSYAWQRVDGDKMHESQAVSEPPLLVDSPARVCVELRTISDAGQVSAESATACVDQ
ncbi:serine/threonine-protein kinase [Georgenia sp. MJ173]|uniref:serine/threonine-protein kinase n=1 Tax=Georgenia sunbinii TaxID=3117728 RepID=UPI002F26551A